MLWKSSQFKKSKMYQWGWWLFFRFYTSNDHSAFEQAFGMNITSNSSESPLTRNFVHIKRWQENIKSFKQLSVFYCCCNKLPQTPPWLKVMQNCILCLVWNVFSRPREVASRAVCLQEAGGSSGFGVFATPSFSLQVSGACIHSLTPGPSLYPQACRPALLPLSHLLVWFWPSCLSLMSTPGPMQIIQGGFFISRSWT